MTGKGTFQLPAAFTLNVQEVLVVVVRGSERDSVQARLAIDTEAIHVFRSLAATCTYHISEEREGEK